MCFDRVLNKFLFMFENFMDFQSSVRDYGRDVRTDQVEMFQKQFLIAAAVTGCVLLFCEWLIYYVVLYQCSWPQMSSDAAHDRHTHLKAIFLADTHLLGLQDGHWFDRLRREWQMERAFQTAISLFHPEAVFVLGDLFDEGMKSSDEVHVMHLLVLIQRGNNMGKGGESEFRHNISF